MSDYGFNIMILGFSASGCTAAVHTGDTGLNPTWSKNFFVQ